ANSINSFFWQRTQRWGSGCSSSLPPSPRLFGTESPTLSGYDFLFFSCKLVSPVEFNGFKQSHPFGFHGLPLVSHPADPLPEFRIFVPLYRHSGMTVLLFKSYEPGVHLLPRNHVSSGQ